MSCPPGQTSGGSTAHFTVCYDNTLPNGPALAQAVVGRCEQDLSSLAAFWTGTTPPTGIEVSIVAGGGGAFHSGTKVTMLANKNTDGQGLSGLLVAEVSEVFMSIQEAALGKGYNPGFSHGEGLSRVLAAELYPAIAGLFASGKDWLDSARPNWVSQTETTDQSFVSFGCAALFLNYLRYQLGFSWQQILAAADNTLALVAENLGVQNAIYDFFAVLARHYPFGVPAEKLPTDPGGFWIDNVYPLSCLYVRHNVPDDGTSHSGVLAVSPDIIVRNSATVDPQATYSTPASIASATESDTFVIDTQDNFLYTRVWNLGADAANVKATVYWSPPATLVAPNMWNVIGETHYPDVPGGRVVQVSEPGITWSQADIPAPGHYCFVATVGSAKDPAPTPSSFSSFAEYENYIRNNNNITWRNFNVIAVAKEKQPAPFELPFLFTGAWDEARLFDLVIFAYLPADSRIRLQVPESLAGGFKPDLGEEEYVEVEGERQVRISLNPHSPRRLGRVELEAGAEIASKLLLELPPEPGEGTLGVAISQRYEGQEVGRITWQLAYD
jgi:hypothetical protein